jgi:hypothetical protein
MQSPGHKVLWTSEEWLDYFRANAKTLLDLPWAAGADLTDEEKADVAGSMQDFQLGESSEGRHLYRCACAYALRHHDPAYREVIRLFIREEQRHARDLGRFMNLADIPPLSATWADTVFRWLRHRAGLELSISVLLTAEILAKVYYVALRDATGSALLQRLCEQILADEVAHVRFQAERLAILRQGRAAWRLHCWHGWQRLLFWGACWVVWRGHARVLRAGGFGFRRFWRMAWRELRAALAQMDPRSYLPSAPVESAEVSWEPGHVVEH